MTRYRTASPDAASRPPRSGATERALRRLRRASAVARGRSRRAGVPPLLFLLVFLLVAAGCSGPDTSLEVGVREFPSDVVLGAARDESAPVPVPPAALTERQTAPPAASSPLPPIRRRPDPTTTTTAPAVPTVPRAPDAPECPTADPFAVPEREAQLSARRPPAPAEYEYRNRGSVSVSGADAHQEDYEELSSRLVENVETTDDGFTFDVVASLRDATTTTSYRVVPESPAPGQTGLFIIAVHVVDETGAEEEFRPAPALKLLEFPAERGTTWVAAGSDAVSGTAMRYEATVDGPVRVDACGVVLDAIGVTLEGEVFGPAGPDAAARFTATYAIATQYGGLSVQDTVDVTRTEVDGSVNRRNEATITAAPEAPPS